MTPADAEQILPTVVIAAGATSFDVTECAKRARALGCAAVELTAGSASASADWDAIRAGLAASNLKCAGLSWVEDGTSLGASDAGSRSKARACVISAIHEASRLGASYVRMVAAGLDSANARHEDAYHYVLDALLALRHEAGLSGISILINLAEHGFLVTPTEARRFLDAVNSPWVGGAVNLATCGSNSAATDWIETLTHRLGAVHIKGTAGNGVELGVIRRALAAEPFDGVIVAPIHGAQEIDNRLIAIRAAYYALPPPV